VIDFPGLSAFDLIRPGVAAFGMFPSDEVDQSLPLRPALRLAGALVKVDRFPAGAGIGYGRTFITRRPSVIGVVPIGYGDGFVRAYGRGGAEFLVHGRRVPVVGRVSMDMTTVDLTDLPEVPEKGEEAVIIGAQTWHSRADAIRAEELARWGSTISYEVTCLLGKRVPRVYTRGGREVGVERLGGYTPR
jgi:alanine racemase